MKKFLIILTTTLIATNFSLAQNQNVAINNTGDLPHNSAMLDVSSNSKGILIPRMSTTQREAIVSPATGLLVFDTTVSAFYYYDGTTWTVIGGSGSSECVTLNEAYNCGGDGNGRSITADNGAVEISLNSGSNAEALTVVSNTGNTSSPTSAIGSYNTAQGGAVYGENTNASNPYNAIEGATNSNNDYTSGIAGYYIGTGSGVGVYGSILNDTPMGGMAGVFGINNRTDGGYGVLGQGVNGIVGTSNYLQGYGVYGANNAASGSGEGPGVYGIGQTGVYGQTENGQYYGVFGGNLSTGTTDNNIGVAGLGWVGVFGSTDSDGFGVYSEGDLGSSGTKSFMIDHPTDPENKFLKHYCTESPEVLNVYRGNVSMDANGEATVELPDYFDEININFSYYLTPVGGAAPNLHVKQEVRDNRFIIAGGSPGLKVSWVLYAQRNDRYVRENPGSTKIEPEKRQKDTYIHPELFGQPESKSMFKLNNKKLTTPDIPANAQQTRPVSE